MKHVTIVALSSLALLAAGCLVQQPIKDPAAIDPTLTLTSYIEAGKLVELIVGTRPTRTRADQAYVPVEVGVVNRGLSNLSLSLESFVLVDEEGNRYPAVGEAELSRGYDGEPSFDARFAELPPVLRGRRGGYSQRTGVLTPNYSRPDPDYQYLPRFSWTVNLLYFPRPETGVRGRVFELFMSAKELPDPVFVRFKVSGKASEGEGS